MKIGGPKEQGLALARGMKGRSLRPEGPISGGGFLGAASPLTTS